MRINGRFKKPTYISISNKKEVSDKKMQSRTYVRETERQYLQGVWCKCSYCGEMLYVDDLVQNKQVCYKCGGYMRMTAKQRIRMILDEYTFEEWDNDIASSNPLHYDGYTEKLAALQKKTGLDEAVITGTGKLYGEQLVIAVCDAQFMMGSMGYVAGEKITRAIERATKEKLPMLIFTCSGGARMQEGMVSLMQMAKTSQAIRRHSDAGLLYLTVLTDPTTGGVTASYAMLGDVILGEPGALVGFAGPRVIEQTIGQRLPKGFQTSEFLVEHGIIDGIIERKNMKETLFRIIRMHKSGKRLPKTAGKEVTSYKGLPDNGKGQLKAWERVQLARRLERPTALDYMQVLFGDFIELHGERQFGDDGAVVGGIATFHGVPVTVIGQQKGKNTKENIHRNFGMPSPEGYRKALRLMKQAEKFHRPIISFIDTPGAFCGMEAEERGQGEAIARNLMEMSGLRVPIVSIVIGEGGSGGALALAVANEVWMLENSMYSILSPEGFASILWKDSKRAAEAAEVMKITAADLYKLGIVEAVLPEKEPASVRNLKQLCQGIDQRLRRFLDKYADMDEDAIVNARYERFRRM